MAATTVGKAISISYGKYFIAINTGSNERYLVWGEDTTDDRIDKVLLNELGEILLFESMDAALTYILEPSVKPFDSVSMKRWAKACLARGAYLSCTYDLDELVSLLDTGQFADIQAATRENCLKMLNYATLISDYAYQTDDQHLLHLYKGEPINLFLDHVYNNYLWTIPEEELANQPSVVRWNENYLPFRAEITNLIDSFSAHFTGL